ncbi:MAG TPA: SDR family oxidoreductase [Ottowia sp.]|jgi:NAD(P)-dependent dehydrogenase (short-subunit alcohol dehydrogenase family)|nr:MAG: short chain dehydrogenase [Burkholderiales bacterium 68-10]HMT56416.1 SDR family oxidoreductase [Ottowia sp.]HMT63615.1 SDR family oxidoreductase [Ottowia sp.]HMT82331.1 SDR family oxidoreductase [Ottowia sp.]HOK10937.1 SDR family oxidoreductase [Ottowia sp.]
MQYFITGATGFIGKRLVGKLLERDDARIFFLVRQHDPERLQALYDYWGCDDSQVTPVVGDLTQDLLGVSAADRRKLGKKTTHFFHAAAVYDLSADAESQLKVNVEGTRQAVRFAEAIGAKHFHLFSSIAAAGMYEGVFREDMFEQAEGLDHPYFKTKHDSEGIVRAECKIPWRVYRPAIVVGDSRTGEMDKIDGPYYFFKLIQKLRRLLPAWMPAIGIEGGRINLVPVDFVVDAVDHIAHLKGEDGRCFHLVDPRPRRVGDVLNIFARAGHAPQMSVRINAALLGFIPKYMRKGLLALTPVRRVRNVLMKELGLPDDILSFVNYPTRFDSRETERALKGTRIAVPPLEDYAWRLWDYWERHLDPDLFIDRSLSGRVKGQVVVVTGASSGIGKAVALRLAEAGAIVVTMARRKEVLEAAAAEFEAQGLKLHTYEADLADLEQVDAVAQQILQDHGPVAILINNAGRSIRRAIENSYERFHDFERTMQLNYFGALRLNMNLLPTMSQQRNGHIINISSIGVLTNAPRFSAYVASKAALDAWTRCAASEFADRGIHFTTINMPLVKTPMIAPTSLYDQVPTLAPDEAADMVCEAIVHRPTRVATRLGITGEVLHALMPRVAQAVMNTSFRMFGESGAAASGEKTEPTRDQLALQNWMRGIHF